MLEHIPKEHEDQFVKNVVDSLRDHGAFIVGMPSIQSQQYASAITFTGHGVMTFDPKGERYTLHWFDCMGSPPEVFVGDFDGDILTLAHGGPGMHARMTYDLSVSRQMRTKMEMSEDGATWNTLFEGRYSVRRPADR